MRLTVLGSGTGIPSALRGGPGYLVRSDEMAVVLDLGMGTLAKLQGLGVTLEELDAVLISHLHPDHIAELVSLLFALKNPLVLREKPLVFFGCRGLGRTIDKLQRVHGDWIRPETFALDVQELGHAEVACGDLEIGTVPVDHTDHSIGFRLKGGDGKIVAYSGDTDFCDSLVELIRGATIAVMECSFPDEQKCPGHLTPSEVGRAAASGGTGQVILSHLYPACEGVDLIAQCRRTYDGPVTVARDLLTVEI
ncbi:MAG: MBL fold metallo-hydrolase [bacterium]|nr:MBL fold metallo-hydrolase [bacterium]